MTPREALDLLAKYAYRCAEWDSMTRHRDAEAAIKGQVDVAVAALKNALAQRRADYYVLDATDGRVPFVEALTEALAELGLISDGGK
jgi:hypothetical protein